LKPAQLNIRKFQSRDRDAVISLWQSVFADDPPHNEPLRMLDAKLAVDDLVYVAENDGSVIGACMVGYDGHRGWLYAVAVSPQHRRSGAGSQLVIHAMQALKQLGCIKVNIQIRSANSAVVAFYQSLGFTTEDRLSLGAFIK
jgi:hypothetical protein